MNRIIDTNCQENSTNGEQNSLGFVASASHVRFEIKQRPFLSFYFLRLEKDKKQKHEDSNEINI